MANVLLDYRKEVTESTRGKDEKSSGVKERNTEVVCDG